MSFYYSLKSLGGSALLKEIEIWHGSALTVNLSASVFYLLSQDHAGAGAGGGGEGGGVRAALVTSG